MQNDPLLRELRGIPLLPLLPNVTAVPLKYAVGDDVGSSACPEKWHPARAHIEVRDGLGVWT